MSSREHEKLTFEFNFQGRFGKKPHQPNYRRLMKQQL
jgi:hypothetical protein